MDLNEERYYDDAEDIESFHRREDDIEDVNSVDEEELPFDFSDDPVALRDSYGGFVRDTLKVPKDLEYPDFPYIYKIEKKEGVFQVTYVLIDPLSLRGEWETYTDVLISLRGKNKTCMETLISLYSERETNTEVIISMYDELETYSRDLISLYGKFETNYGKLETCREVLIIACPNCGSTKIAKDGSIKFTANFYCRNKKCKGVSNPRKFLVNQEYIKTMEKLYEIESKLSCKPKYIAEETEIPLSTVYKYIKKIEKFAKQGIFIKSFFLVHRK